MYRLVEKSSIDGDFEDGANGVIVGGFRHVISDIVIAIFKLLNRHSKDNCRALAYSRALRVVRAIVRRVARR